MKPLAVLGAFLRRDAALHSSYRVSFFLQLGQLLVTTFIFYYIARLLGAHQAPALAPYGGDYLAFVVLGLAAYRYMTVCLSSLGAAWRAEQVSGTFEQLVASPAPLWAKALGSVLWEFGWVTLEVAVYLTVGAGLFGLPLQIAQPAAVLLVLVLMLASLSPLGVLAACGVLLVKEFDPVGWALGGLTRLVSGVYFPVSLLPGWVQPWAAWLPMTQALEGLRLALLGGATWEGLSPICGRLLLCAAVTWPLALWSLRATLTHLKRAGALNFR